MPKYYNKTYFFQNREFFFISCERPLQVLWSQIFACNVFTRHSKNALDGYNAFCDQTLHLSSHRDLRCGFVLREVRGVCSERRCEAEGGLKGGGGGGGGGGGRRPGAKYITYKQTDRYQIRVGDGQMAFCSDLFRQVGINKTFLPKRGSPIRRGTRSVRHIWRHRWSGADPQSVWMSLLRALTNVLSV